MAGAFSGKTFVVTGASRGMGLEWVKQLLGKDDTAVIAAARNPKTTTALHELQNQAPPGRLLLTALDVSSTDSIKQWAADLKDKEGVQHIDYVINNAGILSDDGAGVGVLEVNEKTLLDTYVTNVIGPVVVVRELLKNGLIGSGAGTTNGARTGAPSTVLVHISSLLGSIGYENEEWNKWTVYGYRASKAALNMAGVTLGRELGPQGIESVLFHPGYVATDMNAHQGVITTEGSISGMLQVLGSGKQLQGKFYDWNGEELPW